MSVLLTDKKSTMYINVEVGEDSYKNRSIQHVNPALTDDKFLYFGKKLAALQTHTLNKVVRRNEYTLLDGE